MANGMFVNQARQALAQQDIANAQRLVNIDPNLIPAYQASIAGARLGRAVGGLFGLEDPSITQARQMEEAMQGIDINTPEGLNKLALMRYQFGDLEGALNTVKISSAMQEAQKSNLPSEMREKAEIAKAIRANLVQKASSMGKSLDTVPSEMEIYNRILPEQIYQGGVTNLGSSIESEWLQNTAEPTSATVSVGGQPSKGMDTYGKLGGLDAEIARLQEQRRYIRPTDASYGNIQKRIEDLQKEKSGVEGKIEFAYQQFNKDFGNRNEVNSLRGRLAKIQETNQLLEGAASGNEASLKQLNEALSDLQGAHKSSDAAVSRTSTAQAIGSKLSDFVSKQLTGVPSVGQIQDIRGMLKDMEDLYRREAENKISSARTQFKGRIPSDILNNVYNMDYVGFREPIIVDQPSQQTAVPQGFSPAPIEEAIAILNQNPTSATISYFIDVYGFDALPQQYKANNLPVGAP